METLTFNTTVSLKTHTCISCGCVFAILSEFDRKLQENQNAFYCPNGHRQSYMAGETEAQKLQKLLNRKQEELANKISEKIQLESQLNAANRKLKRVSKGVCPCCNRSFTDLARHMHSQHPELVKK